MMVYSDIEYELTYKEFLNKTECAIKAVKESSFNDHDLIRELFITFGQFHSAAADKLFEKEEYNHPIITRFSQAEIELGLILLNSWRKKKKDPQQYFNSFLQYFEKLTAAELPGKLKYKLDEGFLYRGYFPEGFFNSAEKFYNDFNPETVYCIGIRSIGISFSAAAAAFLDDKGCKIHLVSLRTRGDYENRYISLNPKFLEKLNKNKNAFYLIIDEGSGLRGSSFDAVAEYLSSRGVNDEKIIFLSTPSDVKERWNKYKKYVTTFNELWIESGKLQELVSLDPIIPYSDKEKLKFIAQNSLGKLLIKFIGLGEFGRSVYNKLKRLSDNEFIPQILAFKSGFLISNSIIGTPLLKDYRSRSFFRFAASYFMFIENNFKCTQSKTSEEIFNMTKENIERSLGCEWSKKLLERKEDFIEHIRKDACLIDRNIQPNKWIKAQGRYYKTDPFEDLADHIFPECLNITWNIASFIIEFNLDEDETSIFLNNFPSEKINRLKEDIPFYSIAYCAFRLAHKQTGEKFIELKKEYSGLIKKKLNSFSRQVLKNQH